MLLSAASLYCEAGIQRSERLWGLWTWSTDHWGTLGLHCCLLLYISVCFPVQQRVGLCRPPMLVSLMRMYSDVGIACSFVFPPTYCWLDHPIDPLTMTTTPYDRSSSSACLRHQGHSTTAYCPHLLAVTVLRGTLLSVASPSVDFLPLHQYEALAVLPLRVTT